MMEYKIISGPVEEIRRAMMPTARGEKRVRRGTKAKKSSIRKILRNEINAVKSLARTLNCNFGTGDLWVTLECAELQAGWPEAEKRFAQFLRKLRAAYKTATGKTLPYIYSLGRKSGELDARPHFHIVLPAMDYELICRFWPQECVAYRRLDGRGDYTGVARYMISNGKGVPGKKKYHPSRGLKKPVYTEPVPVYIHSRIKLPKDVSVREQTETRDEESGFYSAYVRYVRKNSLRQPPAATSLGEGGKRGGGERKGNGARVSARSDKTNVHRSDNPSGGDAATSLCTREAKKEAGN